jgi:hypothetical protein
VPTPKGHLIYYVGQTQGLFSERHLQHLQAYLCGQYSIHDPTAFKGGRHNHVYKGYGYSLRPWKEALNFAADLPRLGAALLAMLDAMTIFLAPFEDEERPQRLVEGAIIRSLYASPDPEVAAFQEYQMRYWRRRPDDPVYQVGSVAPEPLRGLPPEFEA